jgi:hypothetical protein
MCIQPDLPSRWAKTGAGPNPAQWNGFHTACPQRRLSRSFALPNFRILRRGAEMAVLSGVDGFAESCWALPILLGALRQLTQRLRYLVIIIRGHAP